MINVDIYLIYLIIFVGVSMLLLMIALFISYLRLVNKYIDLKEGRSKNIDPIQLISNAQLKSRKILEDAHLKAREILVNSDKFLANNQDSMNAALTKVNEIYAKSYEQSLQVVQTESLKMLKNIPNEIKMFLVQAVDDFRVSLTSEVTKIQAQTTQSLQQAYQKALQEVDVYKAQRMQKIDESSVELVEQVTKKVLGKEVTDDEHEKLVIKALEEAKRQGIFG